MTRPRTPFSRLHKPSGQDVVPIDGRDCDLGAHGSLESRAEYDRIIAEWLANGRRRPHDCDLAINELILAYLRFADGYYVTGGRPTAEATNIRLAIRPLRQLYGHTRARDFGPRALKAVRQAMNQANLCRNEVNRRVQSIVRRFKWSVAEELVPASVHQALACVPGLHRGWSEARESEPVRPVPEAFVDAVRPFVSRQVGAMIELPALTGEKREHGNHSPGTRAACLGFDPRRTPLLRTSLPTQPTQRQSNGLAG